MQNADGKQLLLLRTKAPNAGLWSPIGGKLETSIGESPFECAARETREETGHLIEPKDFHLFALLAEKAYEGTSHWLLFLFQCKVPLAELPPTMTEGSFAFFSREEIDALPIPDTDKTELWPLYDRFKEHFVALRVECASGQPLQFIYEQITRTQPVGGE